jgi:hypothetical protein
MANDQGIVDRDVNHKSFENMLSRNPMFWWTEDEVKVDMKDVIDEVPSDKVPDGDVVEEKVVDAESVTETEEGEKPSDEAPADGWAEAEKVEGEVEVKEVDESKTEAEPDQAAIDALTSIAEQLIQFSEWVGNSTDEVTDAKKLVDDAKKDFEENPTAENEAKLTQEIATLKSTLLDKDNEQALSEKEKWQLKGLIADHEKKIAELEGSLAKNESYVNVLEGDDTIKWIVSLYGEYKKGDESAKAGLGDLIDSLSQDIFWVSVKDVLSQEASDMEAAAGWDGSWATPGKPKDNANGTVTKKDGFMPGLEDAIAQSMNS